MPSPVGLSAGSPGPLNAEAGVETGVRKPHRGRTCTAKSCRSVLPDVPVRQWVLSLPHRLRYRLAWDHDLCRRVTAVFLRAVFRLLRDCARAFGLEQPRGGAVAIIQRFGGALNLNVHIHVLVLDGGRSLVEYCGIRVSRRIGPSPARAGTCRSRTSCWRSAARGLAFTPRRCLRSTPRGDG